MPKVEKPPVYMTLYQASEYLAKKMGERSANLWYGYLKHNPRKYLEQDGYKVVFHLQDGKMCYTEASLKAFMKSMGTATNRSTVAKVLDEVDSKKKKLSKVPKSIKKPKKPK
mgnify:FL=1